ncbi:MAG: hypothetical protein WC943_08320, partial [Elusimicrobiota bacterium]
MNRILRTAISISLLALAPAAWAADRTWIGAEAMSANNAGNWSPAGMPTTDDSIYFEGSNNTSCMWDLSLTLTSVTFRNGYNRQVNINQPMTVNGEFKMISLGATAYFQTPMSDKSTLSGPVTLSGGVFWVQGATVVAVGSITVNNLSTVTVVNSGVLKASSITVNTGGWLSLQGMAAMTPVLTSSDTASWLSIGAYGHVHIEQSTVSRLKKDGLRLLGGSPDLRLSTANFAGPLQPGATVLSFVNSPVVVTTFTGVSFSSEAAVNINASMLGAGSRITMRDAQGARIGNAFENDPNSRVDWPDSPSLVSRDSFQPYGMAYNSQRKIARSSNGNLYFAYVKVYNGFRRIFVARSVNNGADWFDTTSVPVETAGSEGGTYHQG